ncbi:MAG: hypothetical protein HXS54_03920 [Theionarchaea archaeon]|jgi:hypothetical protein|nr:hypothetical protein [Theionarchaea archaeon]
MFAKLVESGSISGTIRPQGLCYLGGTPNKYDACMWLGMFPYGGICNTGSMPTYV